MRNYIIISLLLSFYSASGQVKWGISGGINAARIIDKELNNKNRKILPRIHIGTHLEIPLEDNWLINMGLVYNGKGYRLRIEGQDSVITRINYFELPFYTCYTFGENARKRWMIAGGIYAGYGFNGSISTLRDGRPPLKKLHRKATDQYKRIDAGINFMTAFEVNQTWGIRVNYSASLFNIRRAGSEFNRVAGICFYAYFLGRD